ncbi:Crp/Fnr family transcriptional regulator [Flavobacterium suzhouense]|uniref:Crp/Fnr family transcriptional regulator n=1 Tax=Flavobacterium suzhouense TaxID=1529638 RepID=A0ABW5NPW0_9FLAO
MFDAIVTHIKKHVSLTREETELLLASLELRELKKKEHLLEAGQICNENYFVADGCLRMYLTTDKGTEQVIQFAIENWWMTDYFSFKSNQPSNFYIQAIEKTTVIAISRKAQDELFEKLPQLEKYFRIVLEKAYAAQLNRIHYIFNLGGEEQYRMMVERYPEFVQRVPQYMLASFLGITPEFLSKVRAKK